MKKNLKFAPMGGARARDSGARVTVPAIASATREVILDHILSLMRMGIGLLALRQGALPRALPLLERAMGICHETDLPVFFPWMAAALGAAYILGGRVADAVPLLSQALEQTITTAMAGDQALCSLPLGEAHLMAGRREEAQALDLAEELGMRPLQAHCHRSLGTLYATIGQRERARAELETAVTLYRAMDMTFWLPETEAARAQVHEP